MVPFFVQADPSPSHPYNSNPLVAVVDGEPIMLDDLKNAQIQEAMLELHRMQQRVLKEKILEKLSKKYPEIIKKKNPEVSQKEIVKFYEQTPGMHDLGTLEQMEDEIREYLENLSRVNQLERQYELAVKKGWAKVFLKPPNDFRLVAKIGSAIRWFNEDSGTGKKVFVLEYSDFQCPFCKRVQKTLLKLRRRYAEEVQFGYRHFPLPFHKEARSLAEASECARDQDKFWELQVLFFDNADTLTRNKVINLAQIAGVKNLLEFQECWFGGKHRGRVMRDIRAGVKLGIQGTPTFILGNYDSRADTVTGEMLSGAVSEDKFVQIIDKYLSTQHSEAKLAR